VPAARLVQPTDPDPLTDPGHVVAIDRFLGCTGGDRDCPRGEAPASFGPARSWQGDLKAIDALVLQIASARSHPAVTKAPWPAGATHGRRGRAAGGLQSGPSRGWAVRSVKLPPAGSSHGDGQDPTAPSAMFDPVALCATGPAVDPRRRHRGRHRGALRRPGQRLLEGLPDPDPIGVPDQHPGELRERCRGRLAWM
jgi:hypothetical protein